MLTLDLSPGSSSMAPPITLHEIGVDFESRWILFAKREQYAPEYLALNPEGKVPTPLVDRRPLTKVAAILYYLAKHFPEARLLPENDLEGEAQIISWMSFIASTIHPRRISVERWYSGLPNSGLAGGNGRSAGIRSPISTSFASSGASSIRFIRRQQIFLASRPTTTA
jgi:glutathione S-transferase